MKRNYKTQKKKMYYNRIQSSHSPIMFSDKANAHKKTNINLKPIDSFIAPLKV